MIRGHGGVMARRVVVTSAAAREGKTMVAANLAAAMARGGERVLLVDADLRRPSLLKIFDIRIWATLKNYLRPVGEPITFNEVVYSTGLKNLDVLPCERPGDNPADLLSSPAMKQLVRDAMCLYDRIVFDAPPCLGIADAGILAADADATILVVRAFETPKHLAQRAREVLEGLANNLIGVVVNDMDAGKRGAYYARGDYYGRYHYDPDATTSNDIAAAGSAKEKPCTVA
jgi:capsular exopolysaccharide synthesis family protein